MAIFSLLIRTRHHTSQVDNKIKIDDVRSYSEEGSLSQRHLRTLSSSAILPPVFFSLEQARRQVNIKFTDGHSPARPTKNICTARESGPREEIERSASLTRP